MNRSSASGLGNTVRQFEDIAEEYGWSTTRYTFEKDGYEIYIPSSGDGVILSTRGMDGERKRELNVELDESHPAFNPIVQVLLDKGQQIVAEVQPNGD
jgi:hypothetical protein